MASSILSLFKAEYRDGGPWGKKTPSSGRKPSNNEPQADIEDLVRKAQDRMRGMMNGTGGSGNSSGGKGFYGLILGAVGVIWLASGFYIVSPDEKGVVLRFGKYVQTTDSGPNYHLPWPIETVILPRVTRENIVEIGFRSAGEVNALSSMRFNRRAMQAGSVRDVQGESLMLTGDENIVDLDFTVRWRMRDPKDFLFNVESPLEAIKHVSESAMREVVGKYTIDDALTENKFKIEQEAKELIQSILDSYGLGVTVSGVDLQQTNPPSDVIPAYNDVKAANADAERAQNEAKGYANDILPRARGQVAQVMQEAEAYKASKIAKASGDAQRFESQLSEYRKAKDITKKRLYLETMENVMQTTRKVIISGDATNGVLPYLPLNEKGGVK